MGEEYGYYMQPRLASRADLSTLLYDTRASWLEDRLGLPGAHTPQAKLTNMNFYQRMSAILRHDTATTLQMVRLISEGDDPLEVYAHKIVSENIFAMQVAASKGGWFMDKLITSIAYRVAEVRQHAEESRRGGLLGIFRRR